MTPISKSDFARQCNITRQYIGQVIKKNLLDICVHKNKEHIDLDGVNTQFFLSERQGTVPTKTAEEKPTKPAIEPIKDKVKPPPPKTHTQIQPPPPETKSNMNNNPSGNNGAPLQKEKAELEKERIAETVEKLRIDNEKKRGETIPKILIKRYITRLHSIDENQFKTLGINVSPKISAVYNSSNTDKIKSILELIGKKSDNSLKKELNKILNKDEPERILEMNQILEDGTGIILKAVHRESEKFLKNIERLKE